LFYNTGIQTCVENIKKADFLKGGSSMQTRKYLVLILIVIAALSMQGCTEVEPARELVRRQIFRDDFDAVVLADHWLVGPEDGQRYDDLWSVTKNQGFLTVTTQPGDFHQTNNNPVNLFLYQVRYENFEVVTHILFQPEQEGEQAGILLYQDMDNFAGLALAHTGSRQVVEPGLETNAVYTSWAKNIFKTNEMYLKMTLIDNQISYAFSRDGISWTNIKERPYVSWEGPVYVVLYAICPVNGREIDAQFDYVEVTELEWEPIIETI